MDDSESILLDVMTLAIGITRPHTQRTNHITNFQNNFGSSACAFDHDNNDWVDLFTLNGSGVTHYHAKHQLWQGDCPTTTLYHKKNRQSFDDISSVIGLFTTEHYPSSI